MTKKQIEAIHWAVRSWEESIHQDESALDRNPQLPRRMKEADEALTALHAEPHQEPWLDAKIRMSDAIRDMQSCHVMVDRCGLEYPLGDQVMQLIRTAQTLRIAMERMGPVPKPEREDLLPQSALRKPHLQAIRELHKVAHDAWFGDETLAAAERDSGDHGPDEIAAIEANLATVKEAIEIMEKEGLGFIS